LLGWADSPGGAACRAGVLDSWFGYFFTLRVRRHDSLLREYAWADLSFRCLTIHDTETSAILMNLARHDAGFVLRDKASSR